MLFGVVFGGAIIVTFNTRILGGKISLFQSVSILGYCIFPLFFAMVILKMLSLMGFNHILIKIFAMLVGALWGVLGTSFVMQLPLFLSQVTSTRPVKLWPSIQLCFFTCLSHCWHCICEVIVCVTDYSTQMNIKEHILS